MLKWKAVWRTLRCESVMLVTLFYLSISMKTVQKRCHVFHFCVKSEDCNWDLYFSRKKYMYQRGSVRKLAIHKLLSQCVKVGSPGTMWNIMNQACSVVYMLYMIGLFKAYSKVIHHLLIHLQGLKLRKYPHESSFFFILIPLLAHYPMETTRKFVAFRFLWRTGVFPCSVI